jgi:hypothetical protein
MGLRKLRRQAERERGKEEQPPAGQKRVLPANLDLTSFLHRPEGVLPDAMPAGGPEAMQPGFPGLQTPPALRPPGEKAKAAVKLEIPEIRVEDVVKGVTPAGELPVYTQTPPARRPKAVVNFSDSSLGEIHGIVKERPKLNSVGWGLTTKKGETEFIVPEMQVSGMSHRYDESGVVERLKQGDIESVFMVVLGDVSRGVVESFHESGRKIRETAGNATQMYLLTLLPFPLNLNVVNAKAYRFNPNAPVEKVGEMVEAGKKTYEDFVERNNVVTELLRIRRQADGGPFEKFANMSADLRIGLTYEYLRLKFGDEQLAEDARKKLSAQREDMVHSDTKERHTGASVGLSLLQAESAISKALFMKTGILEEIEVPGMFWGIMPIVAGSKKTHSIITEGAMALSEGLAVDGREAALNIWNMASAAAKLGGQAAILKPLAEACVSDKLQLNGQTMYTINQNAGLLLKCAVLGQYGGDDYGKAVSLTVSFANLREAMWKRIQIPGMNDPEDISQMIKAIADDPKMDKGIKAEMDDGIKDCTGHERSEILASPKLLEIHGPVLGQILHAGASQNIQVIDGFLKKAREDRERVMGMGDPELAEALKKQRGRKSKSKRAPIDVPAFRRSAEVSYLAYVKEAGDLRKRLEDAISVTPEDYASSQLEEIARSGKRVADETAVMWREAHHRVEEILLYNLFPGGRQDERQGLLLKALTPVFPLQNPSAVNQAHALIRDAACLSKNTVQLGRRGGALGQAMADAGVDGGADVRKSLRAHTRIQISEWLDAEVKKEDILRLAGESVFAEHALGEQSGEAALYHMLVRDKVPEELKPDFEKTQTAYRRLLQALPAGMK